MFRETQPQPPSSPRAKHIPPSAHIAFVILSLLLVCIGFSVHPIIRGDGWEYVFMTHSIRTTGSVGYSEEVNKSLEKLAQSDTPDFYNFAQHTRIKEAAEKNAPAAVGYFRTDKNEYYSYHFWLYPAFAAPIEFALDHAGLNPLRALQLTNIALVILVLAYLYYFSSFSTLEKHTLSALYLLCGTTYYLFWPHAEIFSGALVLLTILLWRDKRPILAIAAAALASNHNPPIVLLLPIIFLHTHLTLCVTGNRFDIRKAKELLAPRTVLRAIAMIAVGSLCLLSPAFYWIHYHTPNLLVTLGVTRTVYIDAARFISTWFDLNQGVIIGNPGTYLLLAAAFVATLIKGPKFWNWQNLHFPTAVTLSVCAMCLPTLAQTNWNAGCAVYLRYGYWLLLPLLPLIIDGLRGVKNSVRATILATGIVIQLALVLDWGVFAFQYDYCHLTRVGRYVMKHFPSQYNPIPEIFVERTLRGENTFFWNKYYTYPEQGPRVKKILVPTSEIPTNPNPLAAFTIHGDRFRPTKPYHITRVEEWTYLNGDFLRVGNSTRYSFDSTLVQWGEGWSNPEESWRWTNRKNASLQLPPIPRSDHLRTLILRGHPIKPMPIIIRVNGTEIWNGKISPENNHQFPLQDDQLNADTPNTIELIMPEAAPIPGARDTRTLGFSLEWLSVD